MLREASAASRARAPARPPGATEPARPTRRAQRRAPRRRPGALPDGRLRQGRGRRPSPSSRPTGSAARSRAICFEPAENAFFREILAGAVREQVRVDRLVDRALSKGWPLTAHRGGSARHPARGRLRAKVPQGRPRPRVVITEYVDIAHGLLHGDDEPGLVNAVLDVVARGERPEGDEGASPGRPSHAEARPDAERAKPAQEPGAKAPPAHGAKVAQAPGAMPAPMPGAKPTLTLGIKPLARPAAKPVAKPGKP